MVEVIIGWSESSGRARSITVEMPFEEWRQISDRVRGLQDWLMDKAQDLERTDEDTKQFQNGGSNGP